MGEKPIRRMPIPRGAETVGLYLSEPELPVVRSLGLVQVGPGWKQSPHAHGEYEVHYVRRGKGELIHDGRLYPVKAGDVYLFRPGETHGCARVEAADPVQVLFLCARFPPGLERTLADSADSARSAGRSPLFLTDRGAVELRSALRALAEELVTLKSSGLDAKETARVPALQARILHALGAMFAPRPTADIEAGAPRERELSETVLRALETSGGAPPSLVLLARRLGVTPSHLGEALRNATGRTYPEIAAAARLARAKELLSDPTVPIREIARRVGLSGPRALARMFRRLTNKPPGAFRPG
jgi:AraC-like DNA-binding protein/mannose-6-phosphate isomerase-like protein (cupin superfamily)